MTVKRATLEIESTGQAAHFEDDGLPFINDKAGAEVAVLIIEVQDFEEALELVETLNRSRAQKKRERKPVEPEKLSPAPPAVVPPPPGANGRGATGDERIACEAPDCEHLAPSSYDLGDGEQIKLCSLHINVRPESILREWHAAAMKRRTPAKEAAKRARSIAESVEGQR